MPGSEHVTILFTDLVGSTELASALSPEGADEVRRAHFSTLRQAIAASGGSEVKTLGDGLMVVFPAASAALGCAVAMQQGVHRDNATAERPLGLRVGLSSGEATTEGGDYFGDPVVETARLCAKAESGQILAIDLVRANAGRRSNHEFRSLGELELKGLPEPIEVLEVGWQPLGTEVFRAGRVPFPARLAHRPGVGVIGRDEELANLSAIAKAVASGEGRALILVAGEPGQGKTTIVSEMARRVHDEGTTVLLGRCDEEVGAPYRPLHEALTHLVVHSDEALLRAHVASHGAELSRLVPALGQRLGDLPSLQSADPDTERYLLYAAVVGLLDEASARNPVLVVLDDLHWADKPSLQLLCHLVANTAGRLLVVGTYRDTELSAALPLAEALGALHREPGVSALDLEGLDDTGVLAFMEAAAGHDLDEASVGLAHQLSHETDGNPFFVTEVLRELVDSGAIAQDATTGRWSTTASEEPLVLPHSVRTVIGARAVRLGDEATTVLSTAAVIGRDFDLGLLAETIQVDEDTLLDLMEEAQRAALVIELPDTAGHYSFTHALVQHTLSEDLGATRRARTHRAVGEAIERLCGERSDERAGELARHFFFAAGPTDAPKAIDYARRAGEVALEALAPDEAVRHFSQALELVAQTSMEPTLRIDLGIGLGVAQRQAGSAEFRTTLLDAARAARAEGDSARLATAALENHRGWFSSFGQVDTEKVEILEAALSALGDEESPERARLLATLCSELNFGAPLARRLALADEAKAIARRLGDGFTFVDVVNRSSTSLWAPSTLGLRLADQDQAEAIAVAQGLADLLVASLHHVGYFIAALAGRFDGAAARLATETAIAERLQQPALRWNATYAAASDALLHGDVAAAERLATSALEMGTASGQPDAPSIYGVQLMAVRLEQGRFGELVSLIAAEVEKYPTVPTFKAILAATSLHGGDEASAKSLLDELAATSFAFPEDVTWFEGIIACARVAVELELPDRAAPLFELLAPYHDQIPHNGVTPSEPAAMQLGALATVLGRDDEAERFFQEAAELNERGKMNFADASTKLLWGRMLVQRGGRHTERASNLLVQAGSIAASRGYAWVARQATEELAKLA